MAYSNHRSRKTRHAARKFRKPRPSAKAGQETRKTRRAGTKAKYRKGSATWCHARGLPAWGEGASRRSRREKTGK